MHLCVLRGSQNKQRFFPYTTLNDWFYNRGRECFLRGTNWFFKLDRYSFVLEGLTLSSLQPQTFLDATKVTRLLPVQNVVYVPITNVCSEEDPSEQTKLFVVYSFCLKLLFTCESQLSVRDQRYAVRREIFNMTQT